MCMTWVDSSVHSTNRRGLTTNLQNGLGSAPRLHSLRLFYRNRALRWRLCLQLMGVFRSSHTTSSGHCSVSASIANTKNFYDKHVVISSSQLQPLHHHGIPSTTPPWYTIVLHSFNPPAWAAGTSSGASFSSRSSKSNMGPGLLGSRWWWLVAESLVIKH